MTLVCHIFVETLKHIKMNLTEKWRLLKDDNNVTLQFFEDRERVKKNGSKEVYEYTDSFYYPSTKEALKGFTRRYIKPTNYDDILLRLGNLEAMIDVFAETLKQ